MKENVKIVNPLSDSKELQGYLDSLYELRKDGVLLISEYEEEIFNIKSNKKISNEEKKQRIEEIKQKIVQAKDVKKDNKEKVKEIVVKSSSLVNELGKKYYSDIYAVEKEKQTKIKEQYKADLEKIKNDYVAEVASLNKEDSEYKLNLLDKKVSYKSKKFDLTKHYKDNMCRSNTEINDAYLERYGTLTRIRNGRNTIAEKLEYNLREYRYNFDLKKFLLNNAIYLVMLMFFIVVAIIAPLTGQGNFLTIRNLLSILEQSSTRVFFALGVAGLILLGGTDLSIGRMVGMGSIITAVILHKGDNIIRFFGMEAWNFDSWNVAVRLLLALSLSVLFCTIFSAIAGFFTAKFKMHPFISTLGTQLIIFGLCMYATSGTASGSIDFGIKNDIAGRIGGTFPMLIIYAVIIIAIVWLIWNKTKFGKNMYAVGGNPEAASVSGISVFWVTLGVFIMAGVLYGMGSFLETLRIGQGSAPTGTGYELDAIAACVVGGISFSGGIGKVKGAVFGVFIFTALTYALSFLGYDANIQFIIKGIIIIAAVALDCLKYLKKK